MSPLRVRRPAGGPGRPWVASVVPGRPAGTLVASLLLGLSLATWRASPATAQVQVGGGRVLPTGPVDRRPVLLVPGWSDGREELLPLRRRFLQSGWKADSLVAVEFDDPEGSNRDHAEELARAVERLRHETGAEQVDIVAHSMGGLAVRRFLLDGGAASVRRVVFLATPHRGTVSAHLAWGEGAREMEPGSRFLLELVRARGVPRGVAAITIRTPLDLHVLPNENATLPGMPDLEVCCPTHAGLLDDEGTFGLIRRFLESS